MALHMFVAGVIMFMAFGRVAIRAGVVFRACLGLGSVSAESRA